MIETTIIQRDHHGLFGQRISVLYKTDHLRGQHEGIAVRFEPDQILFQRIRREHIVVPGIRIAQQCVIHQHRQRRSLLYGGTRHADHPQRSAQKQRHPARLFHPIPSRRSMFMLLSPLRFTKND